MTEIDARKQFSRGLVGSWASYLGGGNDMHLGMRLVFRDDGSGRMEEWGLNTEPDYVSIPDFRWRCVSDYVIEITYRGEARRVGYDFLACKNEYGIAELRVHEVGRTPDAYGDIGFWLSPFSLVYQPSEQESPSLLEQLWARLKH